MQLVTVISGMPSLEVAPTTSAICSSCEREPFTFHVTLTFHVSPWPIGLHTVSWWTSVPDI